MDRIRFCQLFPLGVNNTLLPLPLSWILDAGYEKLDGKETRANAEYFMHTPATSSTSNYLHRLEFSAMLGYL